MEALERLVDDVLPGPRCLGVRSTWTAGRGFLASFAHRWVTGVRPEPRCRRAKRTTRSSRQVRHSNLLCGAGQPATANLWCLTEKCAIPRPPLQKSLQKGSAARRGPEPRRSLQGKRDPDQDMPDDNKPFHTARRRCLAPAGCCSSERTRLRCCDLRQLSGRSVRKPGWVSTESRSQPALLIRGRWRGNRMCTGSPCGRSTSTTTRGSDVLGLANGGRVARRWGTPGRKRPLQALGKVDLACQDAPAYARRRIQSMAA